jgi:hypothetical protein
MMNTISKLRTGIQLPADSVFVASDSLFAGSVVHW